MLLVAADDPGWLCSQADTGTSARSRNAYQAKLLDVAHRRPLEDALTVRRGLRKGERSANLREETKSELATLGRERALIYKTLFQTACRERRRYSPVSVMPDKRKHPLTGVVNGCQKSGREDSNLRPPEPHSCKTPVFPSRPHRKSCESRLGTPLQTFCNVPFLRPFSRFSLQSLQCLAADYYNRHPSKTVCFSGLR